MIGQGNKRGLGVSIGQGNKRRLGVRIGQLNKRGLGVRIGQELVKEIRGAWGLGLVK